MIPRILRRASADRPEYPSPLLWIEECPLVQDTGDRDLIGNQLRVLEMHVVDGWAQGIDNGDGIHLLPEHVRWVDIRTDDRSDGFADPHQGRDVVREMERVQLERDPHDPMLLGESRHIVTILVTPI